MHGFFTKKESQSTVKIHKGKMPSCIACGLYKGGCSSPKMEPSGKFKKGILNIFDYPIPLEDEKGSLFAGVMGQRMKREFKDNGFDIMEDCLNTTAVKCMPMDGNPTPFQIESCRVFIERLIKQYKPKLINVFGKFSLMSLLANRWNNEIGTIDKWRGFVIPDQQFKCWIAPMYSPVFVIEKESKAIDLIFKNDIKRAFEFYDNPVYIHTEPNIKIINNLKPLLKIKNNTLTAIDYETTGLKPHAEGHKIVCASIATSPDDVYVFMMPDDEIKRRPYMDFIRNKYIHKMAHNCLKANNLILMADGTKKRISELVTQKSNSFVISFNATTNKTEPKPIINWFRQVDENVRWFKVITKNSIKQQGGAMTPDHKIYIKNKGMVRVDNVEIGDYWLQYKPTITKLQKQVILGCLFGDGSISKLKNNNAKNPDFIVSHSDKQVNYLLWKKRILSNLITSTKTVKNKKGFNTRADATITKIRTKALPQLNRYLSNFKFNNGKKEATQQMLNELTPLSIAIWFMDDGSFSKTKYANLIRLHTEAFDKKSIDNIINYFMEIYAIKFNFYTRKNKRYGTLRINKKEQAQKFIDIIKDYIHPDFYEKFNKNGYIVSDNKLPKKCHKKNTTYSKIVAIDEVFFKDKQKNTRFCIEVADNHNFFTTSGLVNNCKFEENWTLNILGTHIKGWKWDSMLAAHIIDNRSDITNLKFQTYVNFGIIDYNLEVKEYLQAIDPNNGNSMNRLLEYVKRERNREELLTYNALDSIHEYRLALRQQFIIDNILPF